MAYQKKLVCFVAAYCLVVNNVFGAPNPKTTVNAADNDVVAETSVNAEAGAGFSGPATHAPGHNGIRKTNPNLYNDIFNIPTSILGAVSRLLTSGGKAVGNAFASVGGGAHGGGSSGVGAGAGISLGGGGGNGGNIGSRLGGGGDGGLSAEAGVGTFGVGASAGIGGVGAGAGVGTGGGGAGFAGFGARPGGGQGFFNDIFNIPITALNAVNQLLNNNQKTSGKK